MALYAQAGQAGRFIGNVDVQGTLTASYRPFKIDHPLDPANRYLTHSSIESPDMMNVYNGNLLTDDDGQAEVVLPDYFEALNRDYKYQLTSISEFSQAMVEREIEDNRFIIRTDKPRMYISWQVTGMRHDLFAEAHRIEVELDKDEAERGHYLHPEFYGPETGKQLPIGHLPSMLAGPAIRHRLDSDTGRTEPRITILPVDPI